MITYYQLYNGRMLYNNSSAQLKITLNEDNEIIGYSQTILENIKDIKEQDIITAYEALSILYTKGLLQSDSTVSTVELGYYMLVPGQSSSAQLLAPTWCFMIDGKVEYFVNAIEGHVFNEEREILE